MDNYNFNSMSLKELRQRCKDANLKTSGKKQVLIERLENNNSRNVMEQTLLQRLNELESTIATLGGRNGSGSVNDDMITMVPRTRETGWMPQVASTPCQLPIVSNVQPVTTTQNVRFSEPTVVVESTHRPTPTTSVPYHTYPRTTTTTTMPARLPNVTYHNTQMCTQGVSDTTYSFNNINDIIRALPEFDPMDENSLSSVQYVKRVQVLKNAYQWRDDLVLYAIQQKLQGHAKRWMDAQAEVFTVWPEFVDRFTRAFPFDENTATAHIRMASEKRAAHQSPQDYYFKMVSIGTRYGLLDSAIVRHIINGINDNDLKKKISNDYVSCEHLLRDIESYCRYNEVRVPYMKPKTTNDTFMAKNQSPNTNEVNANRWIKCYNCGKYGHIATKCAEPRKPERTRATTGNAVNQVGTTNTGPGEVMKAIKINERAMNALVDPGSQRTQ